MKRPNINEFISDVDYMLALDDYADHLERWMEGHDIRSCTGRRARYGIAS